jgi:hypothetical protein
MRHRLSHEQVQTACELGLNPRKLGKLHNDSQEPWKSTRSLVPQLKQIGRLVFLFHDADDFNWRGEVRWDVVEQAQSSSAPD